MSQWQTGELPPYPAKLYRALHTGNAGDVAFYRRLCAGAKRVLELGCGDGRVLTGLSDPAHERIVGLDLDAGLLDYARRAAARPPAAQLPIELVEGDMSQLPEGLGRFDCVIIPHGSLYCLLEPAALTRTLVGARQHLETGGRLVFDVWAADDFHHSHDPEEQAETWMDHHGRFEIEGEAWEIVERSVWRPEAQRMDVTYIHVRVGETEAIEALLPQRYFLREQIEAELRAAGFDEVEFFADFEGTPYGAEAELLVCVATLAPAG